MIEGFIYKDETKSFEDGSYVRIGNISKVETLKKGWWKITTVGELVYYLDEREMSYD